jgi:signal recognition particle subunit SRP54
MSMLPGNLGQLMGNGNDAEGAARIKRFMVIMDSMNSDELDGKKKIEGSRLFRIARGSGTSPIEVDMLLKAHKQFEKMFSKMGKSGLMKGSDAHMMQQLNRNPAAMMQQLQRSMDPRMLAQVGGASGMMEMMKQMGKMDGLKDMMKSMGLGAK